MTLSVKARSIALLAIFAAFIYFGKQAHNEKMLKLEAQQAREVAEQTAQLRQETINDLNANREQIITSIQKALTEKDYDAAIEESSKYLISGDKELEQINDQAKKAQAEKLLTEKIDSLLALLKEAPPEDYEKHRSLYKQLLELEPYNVLYISKVEYYAEKIEEKKKAQAEKQLAEKIDSLLALLKEAPPEDYEKHRSLYNQLLKLQPDNELYKTKREFYAGKVEEDRKKRVASKERAAKIERQFSVWDRKHYGLESYIKGSMNDPDSFDHVQTLYWDRGEYIEVLTTFRGKNLFGGVVTNTVRAKVSLDGVVLTILEKN